VFDPTQRSHYKRIHFLIDLFKKLLIAKQAYTTNAKRNNLLVDFIKTSANVNDSLISETNNHNNENDNYVSSNKTLDRDNKADDNNSSNIKSETTNTITPAQ